MNAGFPEVDGGAVPRHGSIEEAGFQSFTFFFFAEEGATHSRAAGILKCGGSEYRCRKVDANVRGVLPREVAQAITVPTTAPQETSSRMPIFGDTLGSTIVVRGALHKGSAVINW